MEYYCFEIPLPYSIRIPIQENFEFVFGMQQCCLVHLERVPAPNGKIEFPHTAYVSADKYGLYFKSKIVLVLTSDVVRNIWSAESSEIQKLFPKMDDYVGLLFGNPTSSLKSFVFSAVNQFLSIYRVLSQDWHTTKIMPKDVPHIVIKKQKDGVTSFLTLLVMGDQVMTVTDHDVLPKELVHLLKSGLSTGGRMNPLAILEADIHEKATQGDFMTACILMALLSEEAIKDHLVQFVKIRDQSHHDDAKRILMKSNGRNFGISELVDKNGNEKKVCLVEKLISWKPYDSDEYIEWDKNVRELRNEIIHAGKKDIDFGQVKLGWLSCVEFLTLSAKKFMQALVDHGIEITADDSIRFFIPLTNEILPGDMGAVSK